MPRQISDSKVPRKTCVADVSKKNRLPHNAELVNRATEERVARLVADFERRVRIELTKRERTLHDIELDVEDFGGLVKESITREIIEQAAPGYIGDTSLCSCSRRAKFSKTTIRRIMTLHGNQTFTCAYYHCQRCHREFCPTARILDIPPYPAK